MIIDPVFTLNQWFSPNYPLGSFAYSHGMEVAIQDGRVSSAATLENWVRDILEHGTGRSDAILLHAAYRCVDANAAVELDAVARAYSPSAERLMESIQQGDAFCRTTNAIWPVQLPDLCHPVAVGYSAGQLGLPAVLAAGMYMQAFAANLVSCAVRLVPLGQTEGQMVLHRLASVCSSIGAASAKDSLDDLASSAFAAEIASMQHETLHHRIFRT